MKSCIYTIIAFLLFASCAHAATMTLHQSAPDVPITAVIDTEGEVINAVEGTLDIAPGSSVKEIMTGSSIVSFWTEQPRAGKGAVAFSGIIPGGFSGRGTLFTITTIPGNDGQVTITPTVRFLKNDGLATPISVNAAVATFAAGIASSQGTTSEDATPPAPFSVSVLDGLDAFEGKRVAVFAAQDKESGVAYYELQETNEKKPAADAWRQVTSPAVLSNEGMYAYVFVRAVDHGGNSTIARYPSSSPGDIVLVFVLVILLTVVTVMVVLIRKRRKHHERIRIQQ